MRLNRFFTPCALALGVMIPQAASAQNGTWALVNARIETVTRGTIEKGTIVIRDGLIEAVGANVTAPLEARVVDLTGRSVYPGFIDLTASFGLPAPPAGGGGGGGGGGQQQAPALPPGTLHPALNSGRHAADELRLADNDLRTARDAGITAALIAPSRGAFRGLSALVPMRDDTASRWIVRSPVGLHMGFEPAQGSYPGTLLGVIAYERQRFYDAQRLGVILDRYKANPRGVARPAHDPALEALVPVVRGTMPVFFAANSENEIRRALTITKEFGLKTTIVGAAEAFRDVNALKGTRTPVVSVDFPQPTAVTGWEYREAQRVEPNDSATRSAAAKKVIEGNAATLHSAGIKFALTSGTLRPDAFMENVRKAIAAGLPRNIALEGLTIRAAEAAGVESQLGSIEVGKVANLVVTQGQALTDSGRVRMVFVDGIRYEVVPQTRRPTAAGGGGGGPDAQVAGTWSVTTNSPQGTMLGTLTINQNADGFDGTMTTDMGSGPVSNGQIDGRRVSWTFVLNVQGQRIEIRYAGEVTDDRMSGTVTAGEFGSFPFTAQKRPGSEQ